MADENHRVIDGFFVTHAVRDPDLCGNGTTLEVEFLAVEFSANYDNGFWFVWAVAPVVKVVGAADWRGQVKPRTVERQCARLAVVVGQDCEPGSVFR